ncbi:MAG: uracil-DNA glycosylase family protein [Acholeplasmataceae bacterium]
MCDSNFLLQKLDQIHQAIINDEENIKYTTKGYYPLYSVHPKSKIIIVGQAPGIKAQESNLTWNDLSGIKLRSWLDVSLNTFYDPECFGMLPMDFYYPGKGKSGDLPPRKGFAEKWHPLILECLPNLELIILVGQYAQKYYLKDNFNKNTTTTVLNYRSYLPRFFPLVHPSPLNIGWITKNPWFESEVIPKLQEIVRRVLND